MFPLIRIEMCVKHISYYGVMFSYFLSSLLMYIKLENAAAGEASKKNYQVAHVSFLSILRSSNVDSQSTQLNSNAMIRSMPPADIQKLCFVRLSAWQSGARRQPRAQQRPPHSLINRLSWQFWQESSSIITCTHEIDMPNLVSLFSQINMTFF